MPEAPAPRERIVALLPRLRRFCMALAGSECAGDDLAQSTIERALQRLDQWQEGTRFDSWMFKIAQNLNIDQARARKRRGVHVDLDAALGVPGEDGVRIIEGRSQLARARSAMAALPEEQRALLALVVIDGRSYREAAEMLDIPIGTVMSRVARARRSIAIAVHDGICPPGG
jgi:RNA polymerase sigma-70 factor (ECF subfamily)